MAGDLKISEPEPQAPRAQHPFREVLQMFVGNRAAVVASVILMLIVLAAVFGPILYPTDPFEMVWAPFTPPGTDGFILGTDYLGRDMLSGLLNGGRVSLTIGLVAALMSVFIGISFGALAGFYRGVVEEVLMRITEFFQVLPTLLFSMVIVALFGASLTVVTIAIGIVSWTAVARITPQPSSFSRSMSSTMDSSKGRTLVTNRGTRSRCFPPSSRCTGTTRLFATRS